MSVNIGKKQINRNIAMNIFAFAVQFIISFYIAPIIVRKVGASAYGFIGLANDFVSYASVIASVFNSVASRFIADSFYKKDYDKANSYFNSLIIANIGLSTILGLVGLIIIPNLSSFLTVPAIIVTDVKITFSLILAAYIVTLVTMVFTTSTFVVNRTDLQGIRNIINYVVRFILIIIFLNFISIRIFWIALATLIANAVVAVLNMNLTKRLTPEIHINLKFAKLNYAMDLAKSGCWMAFSSISVILMRGLDLTIANVMLGSHEMGLLSIARTMPNNITNIIGTIAPIFTPVFLAHYSQKNIDALILSVKKSINTMALIMFVPICGFLVFSYDFYNLWQKSLSSREVMVVTLLSSITVIQAFFNSTTATLAQLSIVANKLKLPVFVSFSCGIINIILVLILVKITDMGVYAIVFSSSVIMILRYVLFNSFYAAFVLNKPSSTFLGATVKTWITIPIVLITMICYRTNVSVDSWIELVIAVAVCGAAGYTEMFCIYNGKKLIDKLIKKTRKD